jgi:hypothetical protein
MDGSRKLSLVCNNIKQDLQLGRRILMESILHHGLVLLVKQGLFVWAGIKRLATAIAAAVIIANKMRSRLVATVVGVLVVVMLSLYLLQFVHAANESI